MQVTPNNRNIIPYIKFDLPSLWKSGIKDMIANDTKKTPTIIHADIMNNHKLFVCFPIF